MIFKQVETPGLELVSIKTRPEWEIEYHRLFNISPENADKVEVNGARVTVWDLCFLQDLLQIVNASEGLLLDVGWYPHADPSGTFCLRVIRVYEEGKKGRDFYDWQHPVAEFETRCLDELLAEIHRIVGEATGVQNGV